MVPDRLQVVDVDRPRGHGLDRARHRGRREARLRDPVDGFVGEHYHVAVQVRLGGDARVAEQDPVRVPHRHDVREHLRVGGRALGGGRVRAHGAGDV